MCNFLIHNGFKWLSGIGGANIVSMEFRSNMNRREMMRTALSGAAGLSLADRLRATPTPKAKSVIQIWMWGGPCHVDTFDPKPDAGSDYTGPLNHPIGTNVSGVQIGELLPMLAKQADKYSIIRSMTQQFNTDAKG